MQNKNSATRSYSDNEQASPIPSEVAASEGRFCLFSNFTFVLIYGSSLEGKPEPLPLHSTA
jgi:hypothetical protein